MRLGLVSVVTVLGGSAVALADAKPPLDLAAELAAIAAKTPPPAARPVGPAAAQGCAGPAAAERAALKKRVVAWIDAQHPDERGDTSGGPDELAFVLNIGCKEPSGDVVLDVSQDRSPVKAKQGALGTRRNYVLRVSASAIAVIAEDTSTESMEWMEWADEGRISLLAQADVDGDGALDVVYADHEHEGGSMRSYDHIHVRYANGTLGESGQVTDLSDARVVGNQVVVAADTREGQAMYVCLGRDLHLAPCAAAKSLQAAAERRAILERFSQLSANELPDRDQLAQDLAALGITGKRKAALVAAAPETSPADRAQRKVTAFLVKANLVEPAPMPDLVKQTHAEARAYLDDLATKLGDTPCAVAPLTADERAKALAWVKKQDERAQDIAIAPAACGPYTWVAWWPPAGDNKRREVLLGRDGTRILGFTFEPQIPEEQGLVHGEKWFTHDGTIVGIAMGSGNLWVIANGKAVAQTKGDVLGYYHYDDRWDEDSSDVFVDGGALWHATPTGRERLDPALVRDHEARRAAIGLLVQTPPSSSAKYIAALVLLGADKALIAECKKL